MLYDTKFLFTESDMASSLSDATTTSSTNDKEPFYMIEPKLRQAVRVAILLKQPLLLTGKPGTGKTQLAYKLAYDLNQQFPQYLPKPLVFHTKTSSTYTDLLYTYDALGHFHDVHFGDKSPKTDARKHIYLEALGQAILLSNPAYSSVYLPTSGDSPSYQPMIEARTLALTDTQAPRSSVVLIDEIDKAPRDFPNDLLNELSKFEFKVREDKNALYKKGGGQVLVILTSNSENELPDAFLRRCVFYHIDFPKSELLTNLVMGKLFSNIEKESGETVKDTLDKYIEEFIKIQNSDLYKIPATAELISWIFYLRMYIMNGLTLDKIDKEIREASFCSLAKKEEDLRKVIAMYS